jgi:hypothetical protein
MASTLKINTLTGVTTAGSIAVTGEGNSTTTNLQQGLCKSWQDLNGETFGSRDSFNISGNTDHGTGSYTNSYTNSMSSGDYHFSGYCGDPNQQMAVFHITATSNKAAGSTKYVTNYVSNTSGGGAGLDTEQVLVAIHGDLA